MIGNDVQVFGYEGKAVRTVLRGGDRAWEPWFVAADVCGVLELTDGRTSVNQLDEDERHTMPVTDSMGRKQEMTVINESGLYSLILRSRKPEARKFKKWVTAEVLPSIRKHGGYLTPSMVEEALLSPDTIIRLATALKQEREQRKALAAKVEEDKPKVLFAEGVSGSSTSILVGDLAKILHQNGLETGQNRLFQTLRDRGFLVS